MDFLNKLFSSSASKLTDSIGGAIDKISTSDEEKQKLKNQLSMIILNSFTELARLSASVILTEMNGNWLQRSWRPILFLSFGFTVLYCKFIQPAFFSDKPSVILEEHFWILLELGITGGVLSRGVEKIAKTLTNGVDLPFLQKRNR